MLVREVRLADYDDLRENYYSCYDERAEGYPIGITLFREKPSLPAEATWFAGLIRGVAEGRVIALVAELEGRAVGLCTVTRVGATPDSEMAHLGELGILVRRGARAQGAGTALMRAALERSRGKFEVIRLAVFTANEGAQKLYRRLGFRDVGVVPRAIKRGEQYFDERIMYLTL